METLRFIAYAIGAFAVFLFLLAAIDGLEAWLRDGKRRRR